MSMATDTVIIVRLSLVACDHSSARVLTTLDMNRRIRVLPVLRARSVDFADLETFVRNKLGSSLARHLTYFEQIETGFESGQLVCDVLGLVADRTSFRLPNGDWWPLFDLFPWEDWRKCAPKIVTETLLPQLRLWAQRTSGTASDTHMLISRLFAADDLLWQSPDLVKRYDILYQAELLPEALRDRSGAEVSVRHRHVSVFGQTMKGRDRRQLGLAISSLRQSLTLRPVLRALLPGPFSLGNLQKSAEHISGIGLHTQNFRRDMMRTGLLEPCDAVTKQSGNSPVKPVKMFKWTSMPDLSNYQSGIPLPRKSCF